MFGKNGIYKYAVRCQNPKLALLSSIRKLNIIYILGYLKILNTLICILCDFKNPDFINTNNLINTTHSTVGQKILKSPAQKISWSQINQFQEKIFLTKFHFLQFQKWPKINFWTGKNFKTTRYAISRKKFFDLFDFTSLFAWIFLNFSGPLWVPLTNEVFSSNH